MHQLTSAACECVQAATKETNAQWRSARDGIYAELHHRRHALYHAGRPHTPVCSQLAVSHFLTMMQLGALSAAAALSRGQGVLLHLYAPSVRRDIAMDLLRDPLHGHLPDA